MLFLQSNNQTLVEDFLIRKNFQFYLVPNKDEV